MKEHRDEPFLAYLSFYSVHTPLLSRADLRLKYRQRASDLPEQEIWGMEGDSRIAAISGLEFDARKAAQSCMFTVHGNAAPLETLPNKTPFLHKYVIPKEALETLAEDLRILGVKRSQLFPDLENLARELRSIGAINGL